MKRFFLIFIEMVFFVAMAWSQSVQMELTDIYGDKENVEIKGNMSIFLPQRPYFEGQYSMVICNENGEPFYSFPMSQLARILYKNVPLNSDSNLDMSAYKEFEDHGMTSRWNLNGQIYPISRVGEWKFDKNVIMQEVTTAYGQHYMIPLQSIQGIEFHDTLTSVGDYMNKLLANEGNVYKWAYHNGSISATDYMRLHFYANIADDPSLNYTLIVPTDEAMSHYIDIPSFSSQKSRVMNLYYKSGNFPISYKIYSYDAQSGEVHQIYNLERVANEEITNRLAMILRSHTILHNRPEDELLGLRSGNEYYQAIDGSVVRVIKNEQGEPVAVQGAFQIQNEKNGLNNAIITENNNGAYENPWSLTRVSILDRREKGNGWIYKADGIMDASSQSAYNVLSANGTMPDNNPFGNFMALCQPNEEVLRACGLIDENKLSQSQQKAFLKKYQIFIDNKGVDYNLNFVGSNSFTLYVPTNEAIKAEMAKGLPTWDEIESQYNALPKDENGMPIMTTADSIALQQKCLKLTNFIRAHIQFGMEIADKLPFTREHNTAVIKAGSLTTPRLRVQGLGNGKMTVTDETGHTCNIIDEHKNIFVRDISCSKSPARQTTMNGITVDGYTTGVIHQIDGVLKYNE